MSGRQLDRAVVGRLDPTLARERIDEELLRSVGVDHPEPNRKHELRRFVCHLDRPQVREARFGLLRQVHLGHEEAHLLIDVGRQHARRTCRDAVAAAPQPGFETLLSVAERMRMSYSPTVYWASMVTPRLLSRGFARRCAGGAGAAPVIVLPTRHAAGVGVEVFDQTRRRKRVQVLQHGLVAHVDLLPLDERRDGDDHRELLEIAPKVVGHRDDRAVAVPHEHDLRGLVEQLGVGLGHVEAAEGIGPSDAGREQAQHEERCYTSHRTPPRSELGSKA